MQVMVNVLLASSTLLLVALGFLLIFRTVRFFHFAHGVIFTTGAYAAFTIHDWLGVPLWLVIVLAVGTSAGLGCGIECAIYRPLRKRKASALVLLLASLGVYIVLQNVISMSFGDDTKILRFGGVSEGVSVLGARITAVQVVTVAAAIVLTAGVLTGLGKSRIGLALRAVSDDEALSGISGVPAQSVILFAVAVGSALAGAAGVFAALTSDMIPTMGMNPLMLAVVAVVISGTRRVYRLVFVCLLLTTVQQVVVWQIGSRWQDPMAFAILLAVLLVRPGGVSGKGAGKVTT